MDTAYHATRFFREFIYFGLISSLRLRRACTAALAAGHNASLPPEAHARLGCRAYSIYYDAAILLAARASSASEGRYSKYIGQNSTMSRDSLPPAI